MSIHRLRPLLPALLALTIAGCGGGSSAPKQEPIPAGAATPELTSPQVQGTLTRSKYVHLADGVCTKLRSIAINGNRAVVQALAASQPDTAAAEIQRFYPAYAQELLVLEGIRPPVHDRPRMRRLLNIMEAQTRTLPLYARALRSRDRQILQAVTQAQQRLAAQAQRLSKPLGFKVCGR